MRYKSKKRQMKEFIVSKFYDLPFFNGSVTTLAGPQLQRIVTLADNLEPDEIHIYETCPRTFEKQVKDKYSIYPDRENISLHFNNLTSAPVTEFIDADLMKTFKTDGKTIEKLFKKQIKLDAPVKVFIGTLSLRNVKEKDIFYWLKNLIKLLDDKAKLTFNLEYSESAGSLIYLRKYETIHTSKIQKFDVFKYADKEGPMITFRIVY